MSTSRTLRLAAVLITFVTLVTVTPVTLASRAQMAGHAATRASRAAVATRAAGHAAAVPFPIVFVSRTAATGELPGVGGYSRFRAATPGQLLVREIDGSIRALIDGRSPGAATLHLIDVNAPDVSYDGESIAFAGLPAGQGGHAERAGNWRIYVIRSDGTGLRQITPDADDGDRGGDDAHGDGVTRSDGGVRGGTGDRDAGDGEHECDDTDPAWLPDGRLVFSSTRDNGYARYALYGDRIRATNLFVVQADGRGLHRITAERNGADRPLIDPLTGKIVYARWWRSHGFEVEPGFASQLSRNAWHAATINPDGSGLAMWSGTFRDEAANQIYGGTFANDGTYVANDFPIHNLADAVGLGGIRRLTRGPEPATTLAGGSRQNRFLSEPEALPDGRLIVSVASDARQDYGLYTMNADGSGLKPLYDRRGTTELRARAIRPRPLPPILTDPPASAENTFVFDALNVYFNAPVDTNIVSAPAIGSAATLRFFAGHQSSQLLASLPISPAGAVKHNALPANVPLFEQARSAANETDGATHVPFTGGPYPDGAAHVAGMNYAPAGSVVRCVGCHAGHTLIPVPASLDAAKWTNLAPGARVTVSSTRDAATNAGLIDRRALKGENTRYWSAAPDHTEDQWVTLTFPVAVKVKAVRLYNPRPGGDARSTLVVQSATVRLFTDESATQEAAAKTLGALDPAGTEVRFSPTIARVVRINLGPTTGMFAGASAPSLAEIEVIATGDITPLRP